jgi:hypothetical protein
MFFFFFFFFSFLFSGSWLGGEEAIVIAGPIAGDNKTSWFYLGSVADDVSERFYTRFGKTSDNKPLFKRCVDTYACDVTTCELCVVRGCAWCHTGGDSRSGGPQSSCMRVSAPVCSASGAVLISETSSDSTCAKPYGRASVAPSAVGTSFFVTPEDSEPGVSPALTIGLAIVGVLCVIFVVVLIVCIVRAARDPSRDSIKVDNAVFDPSVAAAAKKAKMPKTEWAQDMPRRPAAVAPPPQSGRSGIYSNRSSESGDEPETIPDQPTAVELRRENLYAGSPPLSSLEGQGEAYEQVPGQSKVPILVSGRETVAVAAAAADAGYNQVPLRKVIAVPAQTNKKPSSKKANAAAESLDYNNIPVGEPVYDELQLRKTYVSPDEGAVDVEAALPDD